MVPGPANTELVEGYIAFFGEKKKNLVHTIFI